VRREYAFRTIATLGEQSHPTAKAIAWIRANYAKPLRVDDVAEMAGMGVSTRHHRFRVLTAMSPLQCQKQLGLQAARGRMLMDGLDAAGAAFETRDGRRRLWKSRVSPSRRQI
jgi:AraC-like DNA-binding protein